MGAPMDEGCSCSEARAHLETFLDHECDGDLRSRLEAHVASCEHCSRIADADGARRRALSPECSGSRRCAPSSCPRPWSPRPWTA